MSYRHPNEIAENKKMLEECMHDAVKCGLNEVMPDIMSEFESVITERIDNLKGELTKVEAPKSDRTFNEGVWIGLAIGGCLFIGLLSGLLIGKIL
jgi:hypothetical protein